MIVWTACSAGATIPLATRGLIMIRVITVEREYGSQGAEFAYHLAHYLQWKLIDQCLIDEIAAKTVR